MAKELQKSLQDALTTYTVLAEENSSRSHGAGNGVDKTMGGEIPACALRTPFSFSLARNLRKCFSVCMGCLTFSPCLDISQALRTVSANLKRAQKEPNSRKISELEENLKSIASTCETAQVRVKEINWR